MKLHFKRGSAILNIDTYFTLSSAVAMAPCYFKGDKYKKECGTALKPVWKLQSEQNVLFCLLTGQPGYSRKTLKLKDLNWLLVCFSV